MMCNVLAVVQIKARAIDNVASQWIRLSAHEAKLRRVGVRGYVLLAVRKYITMYLAIGDVAWPDVRLQ
eukprot:975623-Pyramimonas_sp.AAC.1